MLKQSAGVLSLVALAAASPGVAHASTPTAAPPPGASVSVRSINGTGCLPGQTDVRPSDDGALNLTFRAFRVRQAGSAGAQRKQCLVTVEARVPRNYTFGLERIRVRGQATLARGAVGTVGWQSWFVGGQPPTAGGAPRTLTGPFNGSWEPQSTIPSASIQWMSCRANYPLNVSIQMNLRGTAPSRIATNTASFHFAWKRC